MSEFQEGRFWRAEPAGLATSTDAQPRADSRCASGSLEQIVDCAYVNVRQVKGPEISATESYGSSNSRRRTPQ